MILVVSYPGEDHTVAVVDRLRLAGREVVEIDLADFPTRRSLACSWGNTAPPAFVIGGDDLSVDLANVDVVWWRRVTSFTIDPAIGIGDHRSFAHSETSQAILGVLDSLSCPWVNPREADAVAHHKPFQWTIAQSLGLKLPRTLVTSDADTARGFINEMQPKKVVFKAFLSSINEWRETRLVEDEDIQRLNLVRYAPVIFQEYVPGVDLRITMIGESIFAAEIDARNSSYEIDMRMVIGESSVQSVTLPRTIANKLRALQRRLNLVYGAIDMRRTVNGDYVFLEVNPAGQWLFVEKRTDLRITEALADCLGTLADAYVTSKRSTRRVATNTP